jgi:hypothetical protein
MERTRKTGRTTHRGDFQVPSTVAKASLIPSSPSRKHKHDLNVARMLTTYQKP